MVLLYSSGRETMLSDISHKESKHNNLSKKSDSTVMASTSRPKEEPHETELYEIGRKELLRWVCHEEEVDQLAYLYEGSEDVNKLDSSSSKKSVNELDSANDSSSEESVIQLDPVEWPFASQQNPFPSTVFYKMSNLRPKLDKIEHVIPDQILERQTKLHEKRKNEKSLNKDEIPIKRRKSYQDMKNQIRSLVSEYPSKAKVKLQIYSFCKRSMFLLLFTIFILLISILVNEKNRSHSTDFASAIVELKKQVHGQDDAIHTLCSLLDQNTPYSRVIVLAGSTGVGKSYTVEIIKKNFPRAYAVRQYSQPLAAAELEINIPFLHPNLIILENLKEDDLPDVVNFLKARQDIYKNQLVTVLAVFNIEKIENSKRVMYLFQSIDNIYGSFIKGNLKLESVVPYLFLGEDAVEKCIMNAEKDSGLTLTKRQLYQVKQNLLESRVGCKGAYGKVQVIGRMKNSNSS